MTMKVRACSCDVVSPPGISNTVMVVPLHRFQHPWLPGKLVLQTSSHHWQSGSDGGMLLPYQFIAPADHWPWDVSALRRLRVAVAGSVHLDADDIALRVSDGTCDFHDGENSHQPVLLTRLRGPSWDGELPRRRQEA